MTSLRKGSIRLFQFSGIEVFLHWTWFIVAVYEISIRTGSYSSPIWNAIEYVALFLIVTLHEFGHALACRQVGGTANRIVLWPLGGVAYVNPPQRPGAVLWSIAAGPLVNVALFVPLAPIVVIGSWLDWARNEPNVHTLLVTVLGINALLLIFNLLPIYPLDGGQILRSLLWFVMGRARSLMATTTIGFLGVTALMAYALWAQSMWIGIIAGFILLECWGGLRHARALSRLAKLPRRDGFACPSCKAMPLQGAFWKCEKCQKRFDTFLAGGVCPYCGHQDATTQCAECGRFYPFREWAVPVPMPAAPERA